MADLSQAEFARLARGGDIKEGATPAADVVLGISSTSHAAIRRVHHESPSRARAVLAGKLRRFLLAGGRAAETAGRYRDAWSPTFSGTEKGPPPSRPPPRVRPCPSTEAACVPGQMWSSATKRPANTRLACFCGTTCLSTRMLPS